MADQKYLDALFHKYILNIAKHDSPIVYNIKSQHKIDPNRKFWAHLHCFDIRKFGETYGPYIKK